MSNKDNKRRKKLMERKKGFEEWLKNEAELAQMKKKINKAFPNTEDKRLYIRSLIEEFDKEIEGHNVQSC